MTTINRQPAGAQRDRGSGVEGDSTIRHADGHDTAGEITDRLTRATLARITGGLYLAFMVASVLADALGHIGLGRAPQLLDSMTGSPQAFRLGLVFAFLSAFLFLMAAWGLYVLLRPVSRDLALLFLLLNAVGVAIQCASLLYLVSGMHLAAGVERSADPAVAGPGAGRRRGVSERLRHGSVVLRRLAVPAGLPGREVRVPAAAAGPAADPRRGG